MTAHPAIRLVAFVVFAAFVATGAYPVLFAAAALFALWCVVSGRRPGAAAWRMVKRLRWLFLSLLIIYLAFTPGRPLLDGFALPSIEGVALAGARIGALLLLVLAAQQLIATTPREPLLQGLLWLIRPLGRLGFPYQRFAVRVVLAMEALVAVKTVVGAQLETPRPASSRRFDRFTQVMVGAFEGALHKAENAALATVDVSIASAPPYYQWALPVAMVALFVTLL